MTMKQALATVSRNTAQVGFWGIPPTEQEFLEQCPKGMGSRTDLLAIKKKIDEGIDCGQLIESEEHFASFLVHEKNFRRYQAHKRRKLEKRFPVIHVRYGGTGGNKTGFVFDNHSWDEIYKWAPQNGTWFDGYCGQKVVIFDEFRGQLPWGMLLDICDQYPTQVQCKGYMVDWAPEIIYFTSPVHWHEWYKDLSANDKISQFQRRIDTSGGTVTNCTPNAVCSPP